MVRIHHGPPIPLKFYSRRRTDLPASEVIVLKLIIDWLQGDAGEERYGEKPLLSCRLSFSKDPIHPVDFKAGRRRQGTARVRIKVRCRIGLAIDTIANITLR